MFERAHEVLGELTSPRSKTVPKPAGRPPPSSSSSSSSGSGDPSGPDTTMPDAPDGPVPTKPRIGGNMYPDTDYVDGVVLGAHTILRSMLVVIMVLMALSPS